MFKLNRYLLSNVTQLRKGNVNRHESNFCLDSRDSTALIYTSTRITREKSMKLIRTSTFTHTAG